MELYLLQISEYHGPIPCRHLAFLRLRSKWRPCGLNSLIQSNNSWSWFILLKFWSKPSFSFLPFCILQQKSEVQWCILWDILELILTKYKNYASFWIYRVVFVFVCVFFKKLYVLFSKNIVPWICHAEIYTNMVVMIKWL